MLDGRPFRVDHWDAKGLRPVNDMINPHSSKLRTITQLKDAYGL